VSFLNQLKSQANALQTQQTTDHALLAANMAQTEAACKTVWFYLKELTQQLNVLNPAGPSFSLDGKNMWPAMKLTHFRLDARKKMLRSQECYDYLAIGWRIAPQLGEPVLGSVTVNFPPDLERVQKRLGLGSVQHERKEQRHPEKNTLQAYRFEYTTESRGSVTVTPDHDQAQLAFRVSNATGFELINTVWPAKQIQTDLLDELAKLLVAQPSRFVAERA
jgi:hypothetical protein